MGMGPAPSDSARRAAARAGLVGAAVLCALAPGLEQAAAEPVRAGRVVRVERPRVVAAPSIRICVAMSYAGDPIKLICFGANPPAPGETALLFDFDGYRGRAEAVDAEPSTNDPCSSGALHDVTVKLVDPAPRPPGSHSYYGFGIFGVKVDEAQARLVTDQALMSAPSGNPREVPWVAVDRNGDGAVDLLSTYYDCDDDPAVPPPPRLGSSAPASVQCVDTWVRERGRWSRARTDYYYTCR
jgi:hypothetical protein